MADTKDYLTEYKEFFEYFPKTVDPDDQLPVRVAGYSLWEPELPGAAIDWTLQYLSNRKCPRGLLAPLARLVAEEVKQLSRSTPQALGFDPHDNCYMPLKLMQAVISKVNEVCLRFCNNGSINTLPPPSSGPVISSCAVKNSRRSMEDRHVILEDFHGFFNIKDASPASFYAVFDGHAGTDAAVYSVSHLHQYIAESPSYPTDPEKAIKDAFFRTDNLFVEKSNKENLSSGTTAVCALLRLKEKKLYVAWLGDSQAILMRQGQLIKLVNPHKPEREDEMARIQDMGGKVWYWGTWRVNGQLAVSRAIGDCSYKPYVTAEPDVTTVDLHGDEDFFILACDGLWDFVSAEDVAQAVYTQLLQNPGDVGGVSERLVCLSKLQGSADNISVIVVFLCAPSLLAAQLRRRLHTQEQQQTADAMEEETALDGGLLIGRGKQGVADTAPTQPAVTANGSASGAGGGFGFGDDFDPFASTPAAGLLRGVDLALGRDSNSISKADADAELQRQQGREFDPEDEPRRDTPTPPADQVPGVVGLVSDNVAESGEESEDEWNYYKAEPTEKPTVEPPAQAENEKEKQAKQEVCKEQSEEVEDSDENMESQLNPNAAEFIPSPTHSKPSMEELLLELHKTQTADANTLVNDNISSPDVSEEQDKEPSMEEFLLSLHKTQNADANTLGNDKVSSADLPEQEKDYENRKEFSPAQNEKSLNPFVDDLNAVGVESLGDGPSVGLDDSATFSTKAEYGDESTVSGTDFLKMEASTNVMETSLMEQDFLAYEEQTDDTKVLENSVESPVSEQNSEIEINVPNDDQKEPVHISFELQKEIAPHMELQPEIVQVDNDDQSPILDSNQELQTTSAPVKNVFHDEMDFTNLLPKSINETPEIESYMTETKPTLEESAVVATEVMQDLSSNIQEATQNEEWRTHENFVESLNQPVAEEVASAELSKPLQSIEDPLVEDRIQTGNPFDINEQLSEPPTELATAQRPPLQLSNEISTPEYEKLEKDIEASEQYQNRIASCDCMEEISEYDDLRRTVIQPCRPGGLLFNCGEESSQVEHLLGLTSSNLEGYSEENIHLVNIPPSSNQETVSEDNDPQDNVTGGVLRAPKLIRQDMAERFNNVGDHDLAPLDDTISAGIVQNQELTQELLETTHAPPPTPLLTQLADPVDFTLASESISEVVERLTVQEPEAGIQESKESTVDLLIETGSSAQNLKESSVPEPEVLQTTEVQQSEAKTLEEAKTEEGVPESAAAPEGVVVAATAAAAAAAAVAVVSGAAAVAASATPSEKDTKKTKEGPAKKVAPSLSKRPSSEKTKTAAKPPMSSRLAATPPARPKLPTSAPKLAAVQKTAPKSTTNVPSKPAAKPPVTKSAPKTVTAPPRSATSTVTNRTQGSPRAPGSMASATVNLAKARPTSSLEKKPLTNGDVKATSKSTGPLAAKTTATKAPQRPASAPVSKVASRTVSATSALNKAKPSVNGISKPKPLTSVMQVSSAAKTSNEKEIKESANKQISTRSTTARTTTTASKTSARSSLQKTDSKVVANGKTSTMKASSLTKTSTTTANSRITAKKPVTTTNLKPNKTESIVEKCETLQGSKTVIATNE